MDTVHPEESYMLPPARDLLRPIDSHIDRMSMDEVKPQLPSISHMPSYPANHPSAPTDDYLRHRLSDMSVSSSSSTPSASVPQPFSTHHSSPNQEHRSHSPLEPHPLHVEGYASRRGSLADSYHPYDRRRPSITELNTLPLPTSANVSRRGSVVTDYDLSSRSPSPSFKSDMGRRDSLSFTQSYDPFQRRHSIATTAEPPTHPHGVSGNNRVLPSKYRPFCFPATIHESPNDLRPFSAPSSPPPSSTSPPHGQDHPQNGTASSPGHPASIMGDARFQRHGMRHASSTSSDHHHFHAIQPQSHHSHHPYPRSLLHGRRRSPVEDSPLMVRRASMPVVTMRNDNRLIPGDYDGNSHLDDGSVRKAETPYSRSPELRVSHKLAERKRRKEMKELFDELRDSLPVEKNLKTSKWEILSKAVEFISVLKRRDYEMESEINKLRRELEMIKHERA